MGESSQGHVAKVLRVSGFSILAVLCVLGLYAYVGRYVLRFPWLWDNPDYMLFLSAHYFHFHAALVIGHLFLWGPYLLLRRFHRPGWSFYWTSVAAAYFLSVIPLLRFLRFEPSLRLQPGVERFQEIYGAVACWTYCAFYVLLALFILLLATGRRSRSRVAAFHVFSGFPVAVLFFQNSDLGETTVGRAFVAVLLLHLVVPWLLKGSMSDEPAGDAKYPRTTSAGSRAILIAQVLIVTLVALVTIPHFYVNLYASQQELKGILQRAGYGLTIPDELAGSSATPCEERFRTFDGTCNNLQYPGMGEAGSALGRYVPEAATVPQDVYGDPPVMEISERLLAQEEFRSAAPINALAFAWVNFFVHDFYARGNDSFSRPETDFYKLPTGDGRFIYMNKLATAGEGRHLSHVSHWFDASQVYGSTEQVADCLRTLADGTLGAKLQVADDGFLPKRSCPPPAEPAPGGAEPSPEDGAPEAARGAAAPFLTGDTPRSSLHSGLLILHHLWVAEHNYLVDELHRRYPGMSEEELYQTARLIVGAEIAKVHTVEWTAQMTYDPVSAEFVERIWTSRVGDPEAYRPDIHYAVAEEFVSSYVLHEIVPVRFEIVDDRGAAIEELSFVEELFGLGGQEKLVEHGVDVLFNSFGANPMGLILPFNVSDELRFFDGLGPFFHTGFDDDAGYLDLGAIPIARDRDARVPKYNDVREALNQPRLGSIDEMTRDPATVEALYELYDGVDDIEYVVGFKAEARPSTWALTKTQVAAFLPVVTYRLLADRFYTRDYTAETYTEYGIERLAGVRLHDVISQHYGPALLPADRDAPIFYLWQD